VGSYPIEVTLGSNPNYAVTKTDASLTVNRKNLTVTGITADSKVYDGNTNAAISGTATLDGVVGGDDVSLISPAYDNSSNDLFIRFETGALEVGDEINLAGPANRITRFSFEYWGVGGGAGGAFSGSVQAVLRFYKNDGPLLTNVSFEARAPQTLLFQSKPFPILATNRAILSYTEEADFTNPAAADVLLSGPLPSSFTWTVQFTGMGTGDSVGLDLYSPPVVGGSYPDYWEFDGAQWELLTYHDAPPIDFGARLEVAITGSFADKNAGVNKPVAISPLALTGADAGNYTLTQPVLAADIIARAISGTFTVNNKVYDGNNSATIVTRGLNGVLPEDAANVVPGGGTATFENANAGTGMSVNCTPFTLSGSEVANYSLTAMLPASANITALGITGSFTTSDKVYDGTVVAAVLTRSLQGVLPADAANVSLTGGTASFGDPNAGLGKVVSLGGVALSGSAAGNYILTSMNTAIANITPAPLVAKADNQTRSYGEANPPFTISYAGFVSGDDVNNLDALPTASTPATPSSIPGNYAIVLAGGADNNYTLTLVNGILTITDPLPPVITAINVDSGVAVISWTSIAGLEYKLQYKDALGDADWVTDPGTVLATGSTASAQDAVGNLPTRFYRVVMLKTF
jgi:hypothetical protein